MTSLPCRFAVSLSFLGALAAGAQSLVPLSFSNHVYVVVRTPMTWAAASNYAAAARGHLPIVSSSDENAFLLQQAIAQGFTNTADDGGGARYAWLGASDAAVEGTWRWVDGSLLSDGFTNWGAGPFGTEPDNYLGSQNHLALGLENWPVGWPFAGIGTTSQWNDVAGVNLLGSFVEFDNPSADADADGSTDWEELIAGTLPNNPTSVHRVVNHAFDGNGWSLSWTGRPGRVYRIREATNVPPVWTLLGTVTGTGAAITFTQNIPAASATWRTVEVRAP